MTLAASLISRYSLCGGESAFQKGHRFRKTALKRFRIEDPFFPTFVDFYARLAQLYFPLRFATIKPVV